MIFRYLIYLLVIIIISYGATKALRYEAKTYAKILTLDEVGNLYTLCGKEITKECSNLFTTRSYPKFMEFLEIKTSFIKTEEIKSVGLKKMRWKTIKDNKIIEGYRKNYEHPIYERRKFLGFSTYIKTYINQIPIFDNNKELIGVVRSSYSQDKSYGYCFLALIIGILPLWSLIVFIDKNFIKKRKSFSGKKIFTLEHVNKYLNFYLFSIIIFSLLKAYEKIFLPKGSGSGYFEFWIDHRATLNKLIDVSFFILTCIMGLVFILFKDKINSSVKKIHYVYIKLFIVIALTLQINSKSIYLLSGLIFCYLLYIILKKINHAK